MKTATAKLQYARISPQKVRRVADVIRGMPVQMAQGQLRLLPQRPAPVLHKLLMSAVANAKQQGLSEDALAICSLTVDEGSVSKRSLPRARGRATPIRKRTSHITVVIGEIE
ncbi:MAG: 50S ribosomal protein L22 [Patescibacteria group bacterium]